LVGGKKALMPLATLYKKQQFVISIGSNSNTYELLFVMFIISNFIVIQFQANTAMNTPPAAIPNRWLQVWRTTQIVQISCESFSFVKRLNETYKV
jgi:hypothetical protein